MLDTSHITPNPQIEGRVFMGEGFKNEKFWSMGQWAGEFGGVQTSMRPACVARESQIRDSRAQAGVCVCVLVCARVCGG
jgi:hypothetical protein